MGKHSYGSIKVPWGGRVTVGKYCSIAGGVTAAILSDHNPAWISTYPFRNRWNINAPNNGLRQNPDVIVGNDVWIGMSAVLLENTHVCDGAIIGSYSVVHGRIPPYSIAVGNPARVIRKRFSDEQIEALLAIAWWDWPDEMVREYAPLLSSPDVQAFIDIVTIRST